MLASSYLLRVSSLMRCLSSTSYLRLQQPIVIETSSNIGRILSRKCNNYVEEKPAFPRQNVYHETNLLIEGRPFPLKTPFPQSFSSVKNQAYRILTNPNRSREQQLVNCIRFLLESRTLDNDFLYQEIRTLLK